tara:strand:+ start:865 stop:1212 length:348 start_codon:yes stop_codon:yes gene_type:complete
MEYVSMSKADQKTLIDAIARGPSAPPPAAEEEEEEGKKGNEGGGAKTTTSNGESVDDPMHAFLAKAGLSKYDAALRSYGIDDIDFLLEIEHFDMEYVSMSKMEQKTLIDAIAARG